MSKERTKEFMEKINFKFEREMLIRNLECAYLYYKPIRDNNKIDEFNNRVREFNSLKREKSKAEKEKEQCNPDTQKRIEELSEEIQKFDSNIKMSEKENRYNYSGTIADSLMGRKLRQVAESKNQMDRIKNDGCSDYTDIMINLKFKSDIIVADDSPKMTYDEESKEIKQSDGKKTRKIISRNKLRKIAYKNGITINDIHYVPFQRTSSKARTGSCLFIDETYFAEMDGWQNLDIPFDKLENEMDIVGIKSYQSLISSAIIGELNIDPYSILLIDDVSGTDTMQCNVVKLVDEKNGKKELKAVREPYTQSTDLWDGQSLLDSSVFKDGQYGGYAYRDKDNNIKHDTFEKYGFILLRNHFFKTAVFNTNLQEYFAERNKGVDNPTQDDCFGNRFNTKDVLMVTTRNSVKIFKFADIICEYMIDDDKKTYLAELKNKLNDIDGKLNENKQSVTTAKRRLSMLLNRKTSNDEKKTPPTQEEIAEAEEILNRAEQDYNEFSECSEEDVRRLSKLIKLEQERLTWDWYREKIEGQAFGCCKTEHKSKFGDKQQLWYQVIGSLNFNEDMIRKLATPQITEINLMKTHVAWFKHFVGLSDNKKAKQTMMMELLNINDDIARTAWYTDFRRSYLSNMVEKLQAGKLQIEDSDFCTLVGNPYEMLRAACGDKIDSSIINDFECYCPRYKDEEELYGMRSPHICTGNNALLKNTYRDEWKWFNLTDNIIVVNFWGKGAFLSPKFNGCDTDSDSAYIGNNPIILKEVKKVQDAYLIPINDIPQRTKYYNYENIEMAKVDGQLCNDFIGKICNLARDLQSFYWHLYNTGDEVNKNKYLSMMYDDICILEVLSNVAIDSAKRQYPVNVESEIRKIKSRPYFTEEGAVIKGEKIVFEEKRYKKSLSQKDIEDYEKLVKRRGFAKTQEKIDEINGKIEELFKIKDTIIIKPSFTKSLQSKPKKKRSKSSQNEEEKELERQKRATYREEQKKLCEKVYRSLESPMDILSRVIKEDVIHAKRTDFIPCFTNVLKEIPKGEKADYNRYKQIKSKSIEAKKKLDAKQVKYMSGEITFEELLEEREKVHNEVVADIRNMNVTEKDVNVIIRKAYDRKHPLMDKHNRNFQRDEKGKIKTVVKRDPELVDVRACGYMVEWVYRAHRETFLKSIKKHGSGTVSKVVEYNANAINPKRKSVNSLKNLGQLLNEPEEIFEIDGKKYCIIQQAI